MDELWTTSDVAEYLGVAVSTVSSYRARGQMPEPLRRIGNTPVWDPAVIRDWAATRRADSRRRPAGGTKTPGQPQ